MNIPRMKRIILTIVLGVIPLFQEICVAQEYAEKGRYRLIRSTYSGPMISGMSVPNWLQYMNMGDLNCDLTRAVMQLDLVRRYSISNMVFGDARRSFDIHIGIHPTVREAEDAILSLLDSHNSVYQEIPDTTVGDAAWGSPKDYGFRSLGFIRRNAVIYLSTNTREDILSLAKCIDEAFINGGPFVSISDTLRPPVVHSVSLTPTAAADHELVRMIISAEDPEGYSLWYRADQARFGPAEGDPENILKFYLNPNLFSEGPHYGEHKLQVFVVNENNLFSSISEVPITF